MTVALSGLRDTLGLAGILLIYLTFVVAVATVGGLWPAIVTGLAAALLLNWFFTPPLHTLAIDHAENLLAIVVFVIVAATVSVLVDREARARAEAAGAAELVEVNELRTAILAAVSHDLRTPLASIKASVSSLRQPDVPWTAAGDRRVPRHDRGGGRPPEQPRRQPARHEPDPDGVGRHGAPPDRPGRGRAEGAREPARRRARHRGRRAGVAAARGGRRGAAGARDRERGGERALVEPARTSRCASSARRRPAAWSCASSTGGPGIPAAERTRVFEPFQRLGDRPAGGGDGVGLGLAVARGFVEAMGGELVIEETPGGGLTMVLAFEEAA